MLSNDFFSFVILYLMILQIYICFEENHNFSLLFFDIEINSFFYD
jgi:hypothetical protein